MWEPAVFTAPTVGRASESLAERAEAAIENAILTGELLPDSRLAIPKLVKQFGIGATPVREALSRLVTKGLVTLTENKGFRVASASLADLQEITATRCIVETAALRLSIERHESAWEDGIVAAIHRYRRVIESEARPTTDSQEKLEGAHKAFHMALVAGCGLRRLRDLQVSLYDQAYRYRRLMFAEGFDPEFAVAEHQRLADLAIAGRTIEGCQALEHHLYITLQRVYPQDLGSVEAS